MFGKPLICSNVGAMAERVSDEVDGLHFEMADARALARTLRRAASEEGLWDRLAAALPSPPPREAMVEAYRQVYAMGAKTRAGEAPGASPDPQPYKPQEAPIP